MTMAVDFKSMLSKPIGTAERPKAKPNGTYNGVIESFHFDVSSRKKTPFVRFTFSNISPGDDVNQEQLAADNIDLSRWKPYTDYYLTDDALFRLQDVMEAIVPNSKGRSYNEVMPEMKGKPVILTAKNDNVEDEQTGEMRFITKIVAMAAAA
jgi:hypothetical protein